MNGRSVPRIEDRRFLTGRGDYGADRIVPGQLEGIVRGSPYAHARLRAIGGAAPARRASRADRGKCSTGLPAEADQLFITAALRYMSAAAAEQDMIATLTATASRPR